MLSAKGDALVPHVSLLGLNRQALQEVYEHERVSVAKAARSHLRKPCPQSVFEKIHWQASWSEYVRGNIVSESSKNLIQSFLLKTMASSTKGTDDIETEADESQRGTLLFLFWTKPRLSTGLSVSMSRERRLNRKIHHPFGFGF